MKIIILNGMAFNCPDQVKVFHSNNMDEIADWLYHAADRIEAGKESGK